MRLKLLIFLIAVAAPLSACYHPPTSDSDPDYESEPEVAPNVTIDAPWPVTSGMTLSNWQAGNSALQLRFNGQGQLNLFNQSAPQSTGYSYSQRQLKADGTWTEPITITPNFESVGVPTVLSNSNGQLCLLWSGLLTDSNGNVRNGLFRNCQKPDGTWPTTVEQPAVTQGRATFSPSLAPNGSLQAVYITQAGSTSALFYSSIDTADTLTNLQLSGDQSVLLARLAIDSQGGYHAAWVESTGGEGITVLTRDSKDEGATWEKAEQLYSGSASNPDRIAFQLLADPIGGVHLAWVGKDAILYRHWTAAGGWDKQVTLSSEGLNSAVALAVTKEGLAHAVWTTYSSESNVTLRAQAADGNWGAPQIVTPTLARGLTLALDPQGANHISWNDDTNLHYLVMP
jgi:hypothetical protein